MRAPEASLRPHERAIPLQNARVADDDRGTHHDIALVRRAPSTGESILMNTARVLRDEPWPSTPDRARAALALIRVVERARTERTTSSAPTPPKARRKRTRAR